MTERPRFCAVSIVPRRRMLALLAALALFLPGGGSAQRPSSRDAVAAELRAHCERARKSSAFFGDARRPQLREEISRTQDPDPSLLVQLAADAVRLGDFEEARRVALDGLGSLAQEERSSLAARGLLQLAGTASFLEAEDANCLALHNASSCILPIRPEAVHRDQEPIRRAIAAFEELVELDPTDPEAIWLLNLSHMLAGSYPEGVDESVRLPPERLSPATPEIGDPPRMVNLAPALGVDARDLAGGAVVEDFDGDGFLDLVSSSWDPCSSLRAFRSDGEGGYVDVTEAWGLAPQLGGLNLIHADADDDGRVDLLVLRGAWRGENGRVRNSLLLNRIEEGEGFVDATLAAGLAHPAYPTQAAAFADVDLDGDLDLYVGNESPSSSTSFLELDVSASRPHPSQLFVNLGNRDGVPHFRDVARAAGVRNLRFAKGVAWGDVDDDGDPDLYVSNIGVNRLYLNGGDGRFVDVAEAWGVADPSRNFAAWFFDFDNDGDLDLFNADYSVPTAVVAAALQGKDVDRGNPRLYRNDGGGMTEVSRSFGLTQPLLPMGSNFGDLDGDGFEDLYLGTGLPAFTAVHPNIFYRNVRGEGFVDQTFASGLGHLQKGHGVAFADLDHDGDLDLFEQLGGAYPYDEFGNALYRNPARDDGGGHRFLVLELEGVAANSHGVGARVEIRFREGETERSVHRVVSSGGSFGGSSFRLHAGLGRATELLGVTIRWPGGEPQRVTGEALELDRWFRVRQGEEPELLERPQIHLRRRPDGDSPEPVHEH